MDVNLTIYSYNTFDIVYTYDYGQGCILVRAHASRAEGLRFEFDSMS